MTSTAEAKSRAVARWRLRLGAFALQPDEHRIALFRALAAVRGVELTVYFAGRPAPHDGRHGADAFVWEEAMGAGYTTEWLRNVAETPRGGSPLAGRRGMREYDTPEIEGLLAFARHDALLLHGWRTRAERQTMRACRAHRIPILLRGNWQLRDEAPVSRAWDRLTGQHPVSRAAACLPAGVLSEEYVRYYGARRVVHSPNFVDNRYFAERATAEQRTRRRARWGISRSALVCLFVGPLDPQERPADLIRALRRLRGVHALLVGDGPQREECRSLARRFGVPVTMPGALNRAATAEAYAAADVLVVPAARVRWGYRVNEAMAAGRAAIVTDGVGCGPDLVHDGVTGFTYPAGDLHQLRDIVEEMLSDPTLAPALGAAAASHIAGYTADAAALAVLRGAHEAHKGRGHDG